LQGEITSSYFALGGRALAQERCIWHKMRMRFGGQKVYDIIVVGGGHAGCEAALACARLGFETLMITGSLDRIAAMSCNPAIGGVGKGHLVKEMDALGGEMPRIADATGIHFRTLNSSRGPAVQATRCQSDMERYRQAMTQVVLGTENLALRQDDVVGVFTHDDKSIAGIRTRHSGDLHAKRVILTTGTFLGGQLHLGEQKTPGGRAGEAPSAGLSSSLAGLGLTLGRLKTGTCPRLDARTIKFDLLDEQLPELPAPRFSFDSPEPPLRQVSCHITHTNPRTHDAIATAVSQGMAPVYNGQIGGTGPRYCPSIEDKVMRFAQKESHLIFLEPHGLDTYEIYPNGLSTSLPPEIQLRFLRTIPGLDEVEVTRWGYAVEYDFVPPTQLFATLEVKDVPGLFCAGQINGTTGYEEAGVQGLMAGLNVAASLKGTSAIVLPRHLAYAGVLIDDLVTLGTEEPYRMFTSRAEHRLILREDNVYKRLMDIGHQTGLLDTARHARMKAFEQSVDDEMVRLKAVRVQPLPAIQDILQKRGSAALQDSATLASLLKRPEIDASTIAELEQAAGGIAHPDSRVRFRAAVELKYAGYIERAQRTIADQGDLDVIDIPSYIFEGQISGMSNEVFDKLRRIRPRTLGQASRISGITPAAISLLLVAIRSGQGQPNA
jgi:tRNA uridine 5-carboxymethylaminomethyl modification enzyme